MACLEKRICFSTFGLRKKAFIKFFVFVFSVGVSGRQNLVWGRLRSRSIAGAGWKRFFQDSLEFRKSNNSANDSLNSVEQA